MQTPGLWLYGGADKSIPTDRCVAVLNRLRHDKRFTVIVFPGAGHSLVDRVPTAPEAPGTLTDWIEKTAGRS